MVKKARIHTILQNNLELHKSIRELGGYYLSLLFYVNHHIRTIDFKVKDVNEYYYLFVKMDYLDKNSLTKSPCLILEYFVFIRPHCRYERVLNPVGEHDFTIFEVYIDSLDTVHYIAKRGRTTLYDSRDMASREIKYRNVSKRVFSYLSINARKTHSLFS
ncbi:DUF261 family protein [Borrelia sp. RT1S]|uniref:DUF261 family protein n=1 Tax=Borrelia sp. RT1S TaxID=2898580 RepID=UPI001E49DF5F|nr:DUF261 family protein [Borrelia sp. RT1S]UGQ17896.1 DUF261 family protein [Borrelia sp. RT1S]